MLCDYALKELASLRENLQEAAGDCSLLESTVNPALMLWDVCEALGFFDDQREQVLGPELVADVQAYLESPVQLNLEGLPVVV